jgi:hypothetical protein
MVRKIGKRDGYETLKRIQEVEFGFRMQEQLFSEALLLGNWSCLQTSPTRAPTESPLNNALCATAEVLHISCDILPSQALSPLGLQLRSSDARGELERCYKLGIPSGDFWSLSSIVWSVPPSGSSRLALPSHAAMHARFSSSFSYKQSASVSCCWDRC